MKDFMGHKAYRNIYFDSLTSKNVCLWFVFGIFIWLCIRLILNKAYIGQDYFQHLDYVRLFLKDESLPWGIPDPFGIYLLASLCIKIVGWKFGIKVFSFIVCICVGYSLFLIYRLMKEFVTPRVAFLGYIYFSTLPVVVITSVVLAADGLVLLPFILYCYLTYKFLKNCDQEDHFPWNVIFISVVQVFGILIKFTYISLIPVSILISLFIYFCSEIRLTRYKKIIVIAFISLIPSAINLAYFMYSVGPKKLGINEGSTHSFELRSYLPYKRDLGLMLAPALGDPILINGTQAKVDLKGNEDPNGELGFDLLVENRYSYPSLVHLAIHTDIRNLTIGEMTPSTLRSKSNQLFQKLSVICSIFLSIGVLVFNIGFLINNVKSIYLDIKNKCLKLSKRTCFFIAVWLPGFSWFSMIALSLPLVTNPVFRWGYWTPRLILPSILIFGMVFFMGINELHGRWKKFFNFLVCFLIFIYINILIR
jgi:hypothetical protein